MVYLSLCSLSGAIAFGDELAPATFFRGYNLNGPQLEIDGNAWLGGDTESLQVKAMGLENQSVRLKPATDRQRSQM
jgi:hypothetical protein